MIKKQLLVSNVVRYERCPHCGGTKVRNGSHCFACDGHGLVVAATGNRYQVVETEVEPTFLERLRSIFS